MTGCRYGYSTGNQPQAIVGTGLFLMEARKYHRLGELIRAGTYVVLFLSLKIELELTRIFLD